MKIEIEAMEEWINITKNANNLRKIDGIKKKYIKKSRIWREKYLESETRQIEIKGGLKIEIQSKDQS